MKNNAAIFTALTLGALLLTPALSSNLYASAAAGAAAAGADDAAEAARAYGYGTILDMATIGENRNVTFTNNTDDAIRFSFWPVPYCLFSAQAGVIAGVNEVSAASGSAEASRRICVTLNKDETHTFHVDKDDETLLGNAKINGQQFKVEFFKDTTIPTSSIRAALGLRKKANGWVLTAGAV